MPLDPQASHGHTNAKYSTVAEAAATGNRLETLLSLRDNLARAIDTSTQARDTASLARNLTIVLKEIESMPKPELSPQEEFAKKSAQRRKKTSEGE